VRAGALPRLARRALTRLDEVTAHPAAFALVLIYAGLWLAFERKTLDWHAFATLGTLFMTLIIQRAEHRDTQALHANLDELLRASQLATARRVTSLRFVPGGGRRVL
jgi:low affinity Fe/Cu permease